MAEKKDSKATRRTLDFTNVKDRGLFNPKRKPEGDYRMKVISVEEKVSSNNNDMWEFGLQLAADASAVYPYRCVLNENNLWKLRNLLQAAGLNVPKKRVAVDPNKIVGREIGGTLEDGEYEGKEKSEVSAVFKASELTDDEPEGDDEEESTEDSDEEVDDDEDLDELEVDEL